MIQILYSMFSELKLICKDIALCGIICIHKEQIIRQIINIINNLKFAEY